MEAEQVRVVFIGPVFLEQRQKDRLHAHFNVSLITSDPACLRPPVTDSSVPAVLFPQLVEVYCVDAGKAEYHLRHVTPELRQRAFHLAFRKRCGEELTAQLRADGKFLRPV